MQKRFASFPFSVSYAYMDIKLTRYEALIACRDAAGSDSQMARDLGVPQSTMWRWINQSKQLHHSYVLRAEHLYGVSRHDLRPDIYPLEQPRAQRHATPRSARA
jgi:DNA-binding transcriptional regulator YdaS (Cro superfamily)